MPSVMEKKVHRNGRLSLLCLSVSSPVFLIFFLVFLSPQYTGTVHSSAYEFGNWSQLRLYVTVVRRCCCSKVLYVFCFVFIFYFTS